jgi:hypothetical protein
VCVDTIKNTHVCRLPIQPLRTSNTMSTVRSNVPWPIRS